MFWVCFAFWRKRGKQHNHKAKEEEKLESSVHDQVPPVAHPFMTMGGESGRDRME